MSMIFRFALIYCSKHEHCFVNDADIDRHSFFFAFFFTVQTIFPPQYVTREAFATAGGNGSVKLFQHSNNDQLESKATWDRIHTVLGGEMHILYS